MKDVLALLMPIKDKWYLIGVSLEVNTEELESLKISNNSTEMNLSIVISKWLEKSSEATWKALLKEVEGPIVNNRQIGDNIHIFLKRRDVYSKYVFSECNPLVSKFITFSVCTRNNIHVAFIFNIYVTVLLYLHHIQDLASPLLTKDDTEHTSKPHLEKTPQGLSTFILQCITYYLIGSDIAEVTTSPTLSPSSGKIQSIIILC